MRNQWGSTVYVQQANGTIVDITTYVHAISNLPTAEAARGRQTELDVRGEPGRLQIVLDNSTGIFTPGRAAATVQLTLAMPIWIVDTIGYRSLPIFTGTLELPDTVEQLQGTDNLITVTAVDRKQLLDNGRTFISTLAAHIMATPTLRNYYPLNETAGPWRDVVGKGAPFELELSRSSVADGNTAAATYTAGGGVRIPGDDIQGVKFNPTFTSAGGFGFDIVAQGWRLVADYGSIPLTDRPQFTSTQALTLIGWWELEGTNDFQFLIAAGIDDVTFTQDSSILVQRNMYYSTLGADSGLLVGQLASTFGGSLNGTAKSTAVYLPNGGSPVPVGVQITFSSVKLWIADQEYVAPSVTGSPNSPQQLYGNVYLDRIFGSVSHFQIHTGAPGDFTHADFLEQYQAGIGGFVYDRTDERIARILRYASPATTIPAALDQGVTFMQRASFAGKKPGQLIDESVDTERGRFFVDGAGTCRFHSRIRTHYNL